MINLAPLKQAKAFTQNVASALSQANKAKRTPELIQNLISDANTIGNTQRQVLQRGRDIVSDSKELGLSLNIYSNARSNIKKLTSTTGVLPEVSGLSQNTILGKTNTKRLGNTINAYDNLLNAKQESTQVISGKTLKQGSAKLLERELAKAKVSSFDQLSPEAQKRIQRADSILSDAPIQIRKLDKDLVTQRKEKLNALNGLKEGSPEYIKAKEELATLDESLKKPLTTGETHYTLFPNNIQYARGANRTNPHATFIGKSRQAFNHTRRVALGHGAETSQGHLENRISHQLTVFGSNTDSILTGNSRMNKALNKANQEFQAPSQNAQIFNNVPSTIITPPKTNTNFSDYAPLALMGGGAAFLGGTLLGINYPLPQPTTTDTTQPKETPQPTDTNPQPVVVPTPKAKDIQTANTEALKQGLPSVKGITIERTEGNSSIAKDAQGYRYIATTMPGGTTQIVKIDDQFPPQQAPEVIIPPDQKGTLVRQVGKANIASKQGYDIQGIQVEQTSKGVKHALPENLLGATHFGRSAYLDAEGQTQHYDIGTVKLQTQDGGMLTVVANQNGTLKAYQQTAEDVKANKATEKSLSKEQLSQLITSGAYTVMS
ncbi:MAG: hypothetical protein ACKO37_10165 [Vampirovibrionales bacterium]